MREAMASPNREPDDRPVKVGPKVVPIDQDADVMLQFEVESDEADGTGVSPREEEEKGEQKKVETLRVTVFPAEAHAIPTAVNRSAAPVVAGASPSPRNWRKAVNAVRDSGGAFVTVSDDEIREAVRQTGRLAGVYAEPAGAAAVAGIAAARRAGIIAAGASVAAMITGNGLKDPAGARSALGEPHVIDPRLQDVQRVVQAAGQTGRAT